MFCGKIIVASLRVSEYGMVLVFSVGKCYFEEERHVKLSGVENMPAKPIILLINDDGIQSNGLVAMKKGLERLGRVIVLAPDKERSGIGKALSTTLIRVAETKLRDGSKAYSTDGTPSDGFLLALNKILEKPPDLMVAGINLGPNLGIDDFFNSGTLGAALEAAIHGVPAIAVSYCVKEISDRGGGKARITEKELELTAVFAAKVAEYILRNGMPQGVDLLSINVPERTDIREARATSLSYTGYGDIHTKEEGGYRIAAWILSGYPDDKMGTDIHAVKEEERISITPIRIRLQHNKRALKGMLAELVQNAPRAH